jgi:hypothetical protein
LAERWSDAAHGQSGGRQDYLPRQIICETADGAC